MPKKFEFQLFDAIGGSPEDFAYRLSRVVFESEQALKTVTATIGVGLDSATGWLLISDDTRENIGLANVYLERTLKSLGIGVQAKV